jgi:hypothetical protein
MPASLVQPVLLSRAPTVAGGLLVGVDSAVLAAQRSTQILGGRGIREREADDSPNTT